MCADRLLIRFWTHCTVYVCECVLHVLSHATQLYSVEKYGFNIQVFVCVCVCCIDALTACTCYTWYRRKNKDLVRCRTAALGKTKQVFSASFDKWKCRAIVTAGYANLNALGFNAFVFGFNDMNFSFSARMKEHKLTREQEKMEDKREGEELQRLKELFDQEQAKLEQKRLEDKKNMMKSHNVRVPGTVRKATEIVCCHRYSVMNACKWMQVHAKLWSWKCHVYHVSFSGLRHVCKCTESWKVWFCLARLISHAS